LNQLDLKGRVAVITGGARGIGYATAERMLASGAKVVLWDSDATQLAQAIPGLIQIGDVFSSVVDLTDEKAVRCATAAVAARHGQIDILVNNAAITGGHGALWELSPEVWRRVIEVNLIAPYFTCRAVVPHMIARKTGRIINVASVAGKEGSMHASHYSASKGGLIAMTKALGKELATSGILVNCVTPATTQTEMHLNVTHENSDLMLSKIPMARFAHTDEIASMVAWLASPDCTFSTGAVFDISGGRATY
jgi:2-dehydro-3-deoxy-L-rhamnonate dehydrogenase (NAD+)